MYINIDLMFSKLKFILFLFLMFFSFAQITLAIPVYWWEPNDGKDQLSNFGDTLSAVLIERMTNQTVQKANSNDNRKLLGIGSILHFAKNGDVIWGSGINGKHLQHTDYHFENLDVRAVRGPLTRMFLQNIGVDAPEVYGDPALLFPIFFPEFIKNPCRKFLIIPHISEMHLFSPSDEVAYPTEPWNAIIQKIVESEFVIASSLHGIIIAEAFGIPARLLRIKQNEPLFKYYDYYLGTGRYDIKFARSITEALEMGGEPPPSYNVETLLSSFPWELF